MFVYYTIETAFQNVYNYPLCHCVNFLHGYYRHLLLLYNYYLIIGCWLFDSKQPNSNNHNYITYFNNNFYYQLLINYFFFFLSIKRLLLLSIFQVQNCTFCCTIINFIPYDKLGYCWILLICEISFKLHLWLNCDHFVIWGTIKS